MRARLAKADPRTLPRPLGSRSLHWAVAVLALGLLAGCSRRVGVRGTIIPPKTASASSRAQADDAVLWVETQGSAPKTKPSETARISLTTHGFEPSVLVVAAGTRLRFRNVGGVFHTPFSPIPEGGFRLDPIRPGETGQVVLSKPGEVRIFCELHSDATAVVLVLPASTRARVKSSGKFELPVLPAGNYVLSYWHPEWGSGRRTVEIPQPTEARIEIRF